MRATWDENIGESPLVGIRYPVAATSLWRWRDAPEDQVVTGLLTRCTGAGRDGAQQLRDALSVEDFFTLVTFAQRCVLAALRTEDAERVSLGWAALAMIDLNRCADPRDVWMAARLVRYATDRLGLDPGPAAHLAFELADPDTADLLAEVIADDEADLTQDCGMREVMTATGPILVDDDDETYRPDTDLVDIALRLTVLLAEYDYADARITVATSIAQHWLADAMSSTVHAAMDGTAGSGGLAGCVSVHSSPSDDRSSTLLVFVGEASTPADATLIASAVATISVAHTPIVGRSSGRLCAVLVGTRGADGTSRATLTPLADRITLLLRDVTG